jgi:Transglycosylase SLT domain
VYTPYSPEIDTREVRKAGLDYLMGRIKLARNDLAAKKVRLAGLAQTGDTTPIEVSLVLSIIEHIDPGRFERRKGSDTALVHEVLTIIGANTTRAYSYSKSPAGARGLFQLVPDTYRRLQEKYRSAGLTTDFASGCSDHTNAAKASLLLFNSDLASLPKKWLRPGGKDGRSIGMYLAAAYNCGSKRVGKSARECKGQWTCRLPEETRVYLEKFAAVWNLRKVLDQ